MSKKKRKATLATKNAIAGYLFILPFIIGFLAFMVVPLVESLRMSFSEVTVNPQAGGFTMEFLGMYNYNEAINIDPEYKIKLIENLQGMLLDLPSTLIFSFFVALLLNQTFKGRGFVRAIFFMPVILSSGVIVGLEYNNELLASMKDVIAESSNASSITTVLQDMLVTEGSETEQFFGFVFDMIDHVYDIAIQSGIQIIIFLSGLQTISPSMFEAAKIEGCTAWECFWKITLPMVSSLILVNIIYTIIDYFCRSDNEVMDYISTRMINQMDYDLSSAMAWIYFVCCMVIIGIISLIISKRVYYYE
ncbi:MAG: sugar ABC transporter permease [Lachnospiraceae bacterium]|nr:sugar ABC transporter permease [Lachnospiraceae bacterium]